MANRIKAIKSGFGLMLSFLEIIVSIVFLLKMFSSQGEIFSVLADAEDLFDWLDRGFPLSFGDSGLGGPFSFLLLVLCFLFVGCFLILALPKIVEKREREFDLEEIDSD